MKYWTHVALLVTIIALTGCSTLCAGYNLDQWLKGVNKPAPPAED